MITQSVDFEFDSSQYAYIADGSQTGLDITGNLTLEGWVKPESFSTNHHVIGKDDFGNNQRSYRIYLDSTNHVNFQLSTDGSNTVTKTSTGTLSTGVWQHIACTYVASTGAWEIYIGGTLDSSGTGMPTSIFNSSTSFALGTSFSSGSASNLYDGRQSNMRAWNTTRTQQQIQDNMYLELNSASGLVGNWKLNGDYQDASGNGNHLTAVASPTFGADVPDGFESPSISPSSSVSPSASVSLSRSPSASNSPSASLSPSNSLSPSVSPSASLSPSSSASRSVSSSISSSQSPSPSEGFTLFTRDSVAALPTNNDNLSTTYTEDEENKVETANNVFVGQEGALEFMIHQFKNFVGGANIATIYWQGRSTLAPRDSTVYLQLFNDQLNQWDTMDLNSSASEDTSFELQKTVPNLSDYKDSSNIVTGRVFQLAI